VLEVTKVFAGADVERDEQAEKLCYADGLIP
jgi:hypothetical protein